MAKKVKIMKLLYNISIASSIALFLFLFIAFLRIDAQFSTLKLSIIIVGIFFLALLVPYRKNEIQEDLTIISKEVEKLYSEKIYFIIMGIGYSLMLAMFLITVNIVLSAAYYTIVIVILSFGVLLVIVGIIFLILGFCAKKFLEREAERTPIDGNKDTIFSVINMITAVITVILAYLQYQKT